MSGKCILIQYLSKVKKKKILFSSNRTSRRIRSRDVYSSPFLQAADGVNFAACPEDTSEGYV